MNPIHREFQRRRILVLAPRDPYPLTGGDRLRIHHIARELARFHDVTLLTMCKPAELADAQKSDDGVFGNVHRVALPSWRSWLNVLQALPTRKPLQVAYYRSREFRKAVERLASSHDVVLTHLVRTAEYVRDLPCVRVLEMTDAISMSMQRTARRNGGCFDLRRLLYAVEARRMPDFERRVALGFDTVTLTSVVDYDFLFDVARERNDRVMILPNGVDPPRANPRAQASRNRDEIAFVGNLHSLQNFDAVWTFAKRALPIIRAVRPNAVLRIIGPVRPFAAWRLRALPGVRVEGVVESLEAALATARVGVCPIRSGAGVKNKVLDYFGNGLAVVSSRVGLEGLSACVGQHVLLAEAPHEWADSVVRLLADEALAQQLADAGRELASHDYRWEQRMLPLLNRIDELCERAYGDRPVEREPGVVLSLAKTGSGV